MEYHFYSFEKLSVWEDIRELNKMVYNITSSFPDHETFGLVSQLRRVSISIGSNVAEGSTRTGSKDKAHFYQIAYSSSIAFLSQIIVSKDLKLVSENNYNQAIKLKKLVLYKN